MVRDYPGLCQVGIIVLKDPPISPSDKKYRFTLVFCGGLRGHGDSDRTLNDVWRHRFEYNLATNELKTVQGRQLREKSKSDKESYKDRVYKNLLVPDRFFF